MSYKKTIIQLQRMLIEADAEVELKQVNSTLLENGCEAVDLIIENEDEFTQQNPPQLSTFHLIGSIIDQEFEDDGSSNYWNGYPSDKKPGRVVIGIDRFNTTYDRRPYVRVEEQGPEFLAQFDEGKKVQPTFKEFLTEARKANVTYQEERTKGVVTKVIAQLEGHEAGRLTKLAREYHKLSKALDKIDKAKAERNAQLKALIGDTFDSEDDKFRTRVMTSATFAATLAKETHPDDVAEKIEIAYEKLVDGLLKLIADELQPAAQELIEACTRKWKPDPRSPNLSVKPLDEGMAALAVSAVTGWWRGIKAKLAKHLARFDKGLPKLEAQLAAYKAMPKPSLGEEGAKADRKHKAVTTNESAGKFKAFMLETAAPDTIPAELQAKLKEFIKGRVDREISADFDDEDLTMDGFDEAFAQYWEMVTADDVHDEHELHDELDEAGVSSEAINNFIESIRDDIEASCRKNMQSMYGNHN